jgi:putative addiction module CopG family antidote
MDVHLTPEQEQIIKNELKAGRFHSVEEVIGEALQTLRNKEKSAAISNGAQREAVKEMLEFAKANGVRIEGVSVKQLIHEGHRL